METDITNIGPNHIVRLYGRLDSKGAAAIYDTLVELGSVGSGEILVSVAAVTHVTRAGCRALIVAAKLLHARTGKKLQIHDASVELVTILSGAGFDHLFGIHRGPHPLAARAA